MQVTRSTIKSSGYAWISILFLVSITVFVNAGYGTYIATTVFYYGMTPESDVAKTFYVCCLYAFSVGAIFVRPKDYLPKIFIWIFFVLSNLSYYTFYESNPLISLINVAAFILFCFVPARSEHSRPHISASLIEASYWLTIVAALYFFAANGFRFDRALFMFEGVYDVRWAVTGGRNFLENALFSTTTKLFSLLAFGYYIYNRNIVRSFAMAASIALLYSTSAQKSILFFAFITAAVCYGRSVRERSLIAVVVAIFIGMLSLFPQGDGSISWAGHSFLTRRLLLIPAWLNDEYMRYYYSNPLLLSHSILNGVFKSYNGPGPTWEMGYYLWGFGTSLNNGVFSDGFINFGHLGSIFYLGIAYMAIHLQLHLTHPAARAVLLVYIWQLTNSALITTIVTHGLGLYVVIGYLYFRRSK